MSLSIFDRAKNALIALGIPLGLGVFRSDSGQLPNIFIVYTLVSSVPEQYADNEEIHRAYRVQVSIHDRNGFVSIPNVDAVMKAAGFRKSVERQLPRDADTGHFGIAKDFLFYE